MDIKHYFVSFQSFGLWCTIWVLWQRSRHWCCIRVIPLVSSRACPPLLVWSSLMAWWYQTTPAEMTMRNTSVWVSPCKLTQRNSLHMAIRRLNPTMDMESLHFVLFCCLYFVRYGQMTAGSFCYIGPQGIVHGTTVSKDSIAFPRHFSSSDNWLILFHLSLK